LYQGIKLATLAFGAINVITSGFTLYNLANPSETPATKDVDIKSLVSQITALSAQITALQSNVQILSSKIDVFEQTVADSIWAELKTQKMNAAGFEARYDIETKRNGDMMLRRVNLLDGRLDDMNVPRKADAEIMHGNAKLLE